MITNVLHEVSHVTAHERRHQTGILSMDKYVHSTFLFFSNIQPQKRGSSPTIFILFILFLPASEPIYQPITLLLLQNRVNIVRLQGIYENRFRTYNNSYLHLIEILKCGEKH